MQYFIAFLEGIITFVSPCLLPMIPIYVSYFANGEDNRKQTIKNAAGFVLGFMIVFVVLGAFAGSIGNFLISYQTVVNLITGAIVVILGLNFSGIIPIHFLNRTKKLEREVESKNFFTSLLFGIVFSVGWTPCVGAFLGAALMMASQQGTVLAGIVMLVMYSLGLGVPFMLSALLLDRLKGTFDLIKRHYGIINKVSGIFLIIVGILMMTGMLGRYLSLILNSALSMKGM